MLPPLNLQPGASQGPDLMTPDGSVVVEMKDAQGGARDLRAAALQLAWHAASPQVQQAILLIQETRMSEAGIQEEWQQILTLLRSDITPKLKLLVRLGDQWVLCPKEATLESLARWAHPLKRPLRSRPDRSFEVMKVLLSRWLQRQGSISLKELGEQTGLSHPTLYKALAELDVDRKRVLQAFPQSVWSRLLAAGPEARQTQYFVDSSGRNAHPEELLHRLRRRPVQGVAVAGVVAARYWNPGFDLHGLPRLDLSIHQAPEDFVSRLDPALVPAPSGVPPLLVVHKIVRSKSLFLPHPDFFLADPVEVLLDLQELRLLEQAEEMIRFLRSSS